MTEMLKIAAAAIISAVCASVVRKNVPELGMVLTLTAGVLVMLYALTAAAGVWEFFNTLAELAGLSSEVLQPVVKTVGIAIVTKITAEVCRDAKESGLAAFTETAGAFLALLAAIPLIETVLTLLTSLIGYGESG